MTKLQKAIIDFLNHSPKFFPDPKTYKELGYAKGDEKAPFFSEAYLYNLMGKDEARTLLGYMDKVCQAAGIDMDSIRVTSAYTKESLIAALKTVLPPKTVDNLLDGGLPNLVRLAAESAWLNEVPETEHTDIIRQALEDLENPGYFQFQKKGE